MNANDVVRAWKDPAARTEDTPAHPAGEILLDEAGGVAEDLTFYCPRTDWWEWTCTVVLKCRPITG
jgi:hypothetical protein